MSWQEGEDVTKDGGRDLTAYVSATRKQAAKLTGLVCPACRQRVAVIEDDTPPVIVMSCPACGHRWSADEPGTQRH